MNLTKEEKMDIVDAINTRITWLRGFLNEFQTDNIMEEIESYKSLKKKFEIEVYPPRS